MTEEEGINNDSPYRCVRRVLKHFGLIGVFLDTSGKLHVFAPESSSSDRETGIGKFAPPIFEIDTFDQFRNNDQTELFFFGRPLWRMQWQYRLRESFDSLVEFAAHKLLPPQLQKSPEGLCAVFICRFGLQPRKELADSLVANHMATLVDVSEDRQAVEIHYKSEPILSEASAWLTSYGGVAAGDVMQQVSDKLNSNVLKSDKGDRGEVAAAAWLGFSLDTVRKKDTDYNAATSNLSREVEVLEFLQVVCPDMNNEVDFTTVLEGWKVNFTHFCRLGFTPGKSILKKCWNQRAALYLPEGEEGLDLLITIMKKTEEETFATLRVQVKNYKNQITEKTISDLLQKLDVRRCAPRMLLNDEPFSIALLIQVGGGAMSNHSDLINLGRPTRSNETASSQQLQLACTVSGQYERAIHSIAGPSADNRVFIGSSEAFRAGEWFKSNSEEE